MSAIEWERSGSYQASSAKQRSVRPSNGVRRPTRLLSGERVHHKSSQSSPEFEKTVLNLCLKPDLGQNGTRRCFAYLKAMQDSTECAKANNLRVKIDV